MQIAGVLQLTNRTLYGMTSRNVPMYLFTPLNRALPSMAVASSARKKEKNMLVLVNPCSDAAECEGKLQRGSIHSVFGECGDMAAERKAVDYAYSPVRWKTFPAIVDPYSVPAGLSHLSLEDVPTINIDPPRCVDIDDCVSIWPGYGSTTHVAVTIADVGEWVRFNQWMRYAAGIGQTLYSPEGKIIHSMFPHEQRMSLTPGMKRLGIALMFDWSGSAVSNMRFREVIIANKASYTYDNVHAATDFPVETLRNVCESLAKRPLADAHEWIETLMTTYNLEFAAMLGGLGRGLLRAHDAPHVLKSLTYDTLGLPNHLAMSSARYEPASSHSTHYLFGRAYCHATSPIRRWADVVNQMAFKGMHLGDCAAETCNDTQRYAKSHAQDLQFLEIIAGPKRPVGGVVVSETRIWVEEWKRLITCRNDLPFGSSVEIDYHVDMSKPTWKQRVIFRVQKSEE